MNILLVEACEPRLFARFEFLGKSYISRILSVSNHPQITVLSRYNQCIADPCHVQFLPPLNSRSIL